MRCTSRVAVVLATWGVLVAAFATSALAGGWQASTMLSAPGQEGRSPAIALNGRGEGVAVWLNHYGFNWNIAAAVRSASGEWQQPTVISTPGHIGFHPEVAVDSKGDAIAVWRDGDSEQIEAAIHKAGGEWDAPVAISAAGNNEKPTVALDSGGEAVIVWERQEGSRYIIQAAVGSVESGVWQEPVDLSTPGQAAGNPQVAMDSEGEATAVWQSYDEGDYYIQAATGSIGHDAWRKPIDLSVSGPLADQVTANPRITVNEAGEAIATWERGGFELEPYATQVAVRLIGGEWEAPSTLSSSSSPSADFPQVALDATGDSVVVWENRGAEVPPIQSATRPAGSDAWQSPVDLAGSTGKTYSPDVAMDANGEALAVWTNNGSSIEAASSPAGAQWLSPTRISSTGPVSSPLVAMDARGNAVAIWEGEGSAESGYGIQSASYTAEPEQPGNEESEPGGYQETKLGIVSVPAGSPAPESVSAQNPGQPGAQVKAPSSTNPLLAPVQNRCRALEHTRSARKARARAHRRRLAEHGCAAQVRIRHSR
jgi:hypothetical protein